MKSTDKKTTEYFHCMYLYILKSSSVNNELSASAILVERETDQV